MISFSRQAISHIFILLVVIVNLVLLDIKAFEKPVEKADTSPLITPYPTRGATEDKCPSACLDLISEANQLPTAAPTTTPLPKTVLPPASEVKEYYIPLGQGSTKNSTWVEMPGMEAVIDAVNYPQVKSIIFEAALRIPTANGKVYTKLYNVTDKHDVWFSEVSAEGAASYRAESGEISLSPGRKLYRVMMKSSMGYEAILDWARVKIILK